MIMMKLKLRALQSFFKNHPILFAIFALIVSRIAGIGTVGLIQTLRPEWTIQNELGWLLMAVYAGVVVCLVYWTNTADETGLAKPASWREWLLASPLVLLPMFVILQNGVQSWGFSHNLVLGIAAVGVAVNEEVLFRGILLQGFLKWGPWVAILAPSALFALAHSTNLFAGGDSTFAIYQTVWTFASGVALSAMRLRNRSLYPVIVLHILVDAVEYYSTGEYGVHSQSFSMSMLLMFVMLNVAIAVYALAVFYRSRNNHSR